MNIPRWLLTGLGGLVLAGLLMGTLVPLLTALDVSMPRWSLQAISAAVAAASIFGFWLAGRKPRRTGAPDEG